MWHKDVIERMWLFKDNLMQVQRQLWTPGGAKVQDSKSCGSRNCLSGSTTIILYGDLLVSTSLCTTTIPSGIIDWPLLIFSCVFAFSLVKSLQIYCYICISGKSIPFRTFLIPSWLLLQHKKGRTFNFIAFVNHCGHICSRKSCSSRGATPSMLTTVRNTTEPPCAVFTVNL